jgi:hypothetical protein
MRQTGRTKPGEHCKKKVTVKLHFIALFSSNHKEEERMDKRIWSSFVPCFRGSVLPGESPLKFRHVVALPSFILITFIIINWNEKPVFGLKYFFFSVENN